MAEERLSSEDILLGEIEVPLDLGGVAFVKPWGIRTARRMMGRIKTVLRMGLGATSGNIDIGELLDASYDEVVSLVADSLKIEVAELEDEEKYTLSDLIALTDAIIRVNFTERPGLLKNLNGLLGTVNVLMPKGADESPSESESETKTPSDPQ